MEHRGGLPPTIGTQRNGLCHRVGVASGQRGRQPAPCGDGLARCAVSQIMVTSLRSKWAVGKAVRAGLALKGAYLSKSIRNRRATRPPAHFQRNPPGRGRLAVFPRCSLGPYGSRYGRFARALKNSQLTCGDVTHYMRDGTLALIVSEGSSLCPAQRARLAKA